MDFDFTDDQASLREGEGWEGQIRRALLESRHLVCLWSAQASASQALA